MDKIPDYGLNENYASFAEIQEEINTLNLGTASTKTAGTLAGNVLLLAEDNKLPALNGSLLTNLPAVTPPKEIRQVVFFQTTAFASGSTAIPLDDTIPQQTEGTQFMSQAFTPTASDSIIEIEVLANLENQSGIYSVIGALFKDSEANALAATRTLSHFTAGCQLFIKHRELASSTAARTYKFRAGATNTVVVSLNGYSSRLLGGSSGSYIKITEYAL